MHIEELLKSYRKNKAYVETTLQRINVWEDILNKGNAQDFIWTPIIELGMPKAPGHNTSSPVEKEVCGKEVSTEKVRDWIKDDRSRIFMKKLEIEQIDNALTSLSKEQRYVIECKYFDSLDWRTIEINFNNQNFRKDYITDKTIMRIKDESLKLLSEILEPFYKQIYAV